MASIISDDANDQDNKDNICSICLENLNKPVKLPCHHSFCSLCLDGGWRSKYDGLSKRTCPQCRTNVPPSKEMVIQLNVNRKLCNTMQEKLKEPGPLSLEEQDPYISSFLLSEGMEIIRGISNPDQQQYVLRAAIQMRLGPLLKSTAQLELAVGDSEHLLQDTGDDEMDLPREINKAAGANNVQMVLDWLGPPPVPAARINAKCRDHMNRALLHEAEFMNNVGLMRLLLQMGAKVDPQSAFGMTPFLQQACCDPKLDEAARLLLTWGAEITDNHKEYAGGNEKRDEKLAELLETPLGGRRCL
jgi:hypothetical protein